MTDKLKQAARQALRDALAQALTSAYVCDRVWSAWSCGTMSEEDFTPASECDELLDELVAAALSHPEPEAVQVPQGWRLVPEDPTQEILRRHSENTDGLDEYTARQDWHAMLAAAPQPPAQPEARGDEKPRAWIRADWSGSAPEELTFDRPDTRSPAQTEHVPEAGFGEPVNRRLLEALRYCIKQVPELATVPGVNCAIAEAEAQLAAKPDQVPPSIREAVEAAFEQRPGWRQKIAAAVRHLGEPAAAQPVGREPLTDEKINDLIPSPYRGEDYIGYSRTDLCELARAVEHAHGITGEGV